MDNPLVSVIIPAYNCARFVEHSIRSVLEQNISAIEIIVIDDASTDNTLEVLQRLAQANDVVRVFQNEANMGVAQTRNRAIDCASGIYIAFLDGDDIWLPGKLSAQIALIQKERADLCYTSYGFIDILGNIRGTRPYLVPQQVDYEQLLCENVIGLSTVLVTREALAGFRFESRWFHEDYALWLSLLKGGRKACGLPEILVQYRQGGRSSNKWRSAKNRWEIYRQAEHLSVCRAGYYMWRYARTAVKKYL